MRRMKRLVASTPLSRKLIAHRSALLEAAERRHARDIRVFGSVARGEDSFDSDVDLLVTVQRDAKPLDLIALACDVEDLLGVRVDVGTLQSLRPDLRDEVLAEAVEL
jgi:predicted nucleotidyltransferase